LAVNQWALLYSSPTVVPPLTKKRITLKCITARVNCLFSQIDGLFKMMFCDNQQLHTVDIELKYHTQINRYNRYPLWDRQMR